MYLSCWSYTELIICHYTKTHYHNCYVRKAHSILYVTYIKAYSYVCRIDSVHIRLDVNYIKTFMFVILIVYIPDYMLFISCSYMFVILIVYLIKELIFILKPSQFCHSKGGLMWHCLAKNLFRLICKDKIYSYDISWKSLGICWKSFSIGV